MVKKGYGASPNILGPERIINISLLGDIASIFFLLTAVCGRISCAVWMVRLATLRWIKYILYGCMVFTGITNLVMVVYYSATLSSSEHDPGQDGWGRLTKSAPNCVRGSM